MTDRALQELAARCLDCMVFYQNARRTPKAKALMIAEVRAVAASLMPLIGGETMRVESLEAMVRDGLIVRFGEESGLHLFHEFKEACAPPGALAPSLMSARV